MPDVVFLEDAQGVYLACNPVFERFIGRPAKEILGRTDAELMSPALADTVIQNDQRALQAWQPLVFEETVTFAADGYQGQFETIRPRSATRQAVPRACWASRATSPTASAPPRRSNAWPSTTPHPVAQPPPAARPPAPPGTQQPAHPPARRLLFIDLDNFKDQRHPGPRLVGDQLSSRSPGVWCAACTECDTVARLAATNSSSCSEGLDTDTDHAACQAETVARKLPWPSTPRSSWQTSSTTAPQHRPGPSLARERQSVDELLKRADLAMYEAKPPGATPPLRFDPGSKPCTSAPAWKLTCARACSAANSIKLPGRRRPPGPHQGRQAPARWNPERGAISPSNSSPRTDRPHPAAGPAHPCTPPASSSCAGRTNRNRPPEYIIAVNVSAGNFSQPDSQPRSYTCARPVPT